MQVKEIKHEGLAHELEITIDAKDIDARVDNRLKEVSKTIRMPGFRPGKVPMNIMKKRYGKAVMGEVLESAVNETSDKVIKDKGLKPALQPKIEVKEFDDGKDLVYSLNVEVLPEFKLADLKGIKLEKPVAKAEKKAVDEALERIASSNQSTEEIKTKRATKDGDIVIIDFHGRTADDNKEHPGMHAHDHQLKLGSGQFINGFEEQLVGKKPGEKVEVKVSFPEAYGAAELAGRDAIFDCEIKAIHEAVTPKIDDEFAKSLGLDDLKALKAAIEEQVQKELDNHSRMKLKKSLLDILDEKHDFEVPASMLDMELESIIRQVEMENAQSGNEEKLSDSDKDELKVIAERRVRLGLVLSEIGNENKIQVADADLQKAVISEAQKYPGQEKQVFDYYSKNRQALESLRAPIFEEKVVDFILELVDVKEKDVSVDELTAEEEEETKPKAKKPAAKKASTSKKAAGDKAAGDKAAEKKPAAKKAAAKKPAAKKKTAAKK
ncbi:MAG: trigger factor [Micavibrio sp.]|mgnify:CR=1 FL=1|nr:trigger factor [Micavibrio sp.]